jgi:hypothetical protein
VVLVVEHGSTRGGRWLRRQRLKIALWVAVAEGVLVLAGVIPGWTAIALGVALVLFYVVVGRRLSHDTARHVSWIGAVSQLLVALLPVLVGLLTMIAIIALVVFAAVALALLFLDRR